MKLKKQLFALLAILVTTPVMAEECPADANHRSDLSKPISSYSYVQNGDIKVSCIVESFNGNDGSFSLACSNGSKIWQTDLHCKSFDTDFTCSHFVNVLDVEGGHFKLKDITDFPDYGLTITCSSKKFTVIRQINAHQNALSFYIYIEAAFRYNPPQKPVGF